MKYRLLLILLLSGVISEMNAQNTDASIQNQGVVVNKTMIERFNAVKTDGGFYSWSQLFVSAGSENAREVLISYRNCDLSQESMESVYLALNEKIKVEEQPDSSSINEYIAFINKAKQEIRDKLGAEVPVAMK